MSPNSSEEHRKKSFWQSSKRQFWTYGRKRAKISEWTPKNMKGKLLFWMGKEREYLKCGKTDHTARKNFKNAKKKLKMKSWQQKYP
ncbi:MAG: hypothetical protein A2374_05010 [Candidatus Moranbacteria bacterium RIFOXYB1_FULL_44_23]|nr:MAG: hypothetical protein A2374_05010 [Candidatus Moranbacteria bacterium RIFOXYB1_FULL_44_23]HBB36689.1 hypothetical protein [Candidatus Moranbacteria bacterium]HBU25093.1 hypothetical protein [Candidatus Moranbacteria bacterium]